MNAPTVDQFKAKGYKINVYHYRPVFSKEIRALIKFLPHKRAEKFVHNHLVDGLEIKKNLLQNDIFPRGGVTILELVREGESLKITSTCSCKDIFSKKIGLQKCLWRAYSKIK